MTGSPDWEAISAIGQMVGAVGVIISLVFVGLQVRAETRARRNFTLQQEYRAQSEFQRALGFDADAADIYFRGLRDPSSLSELENMRFSLLMDSLFRGFEATLHYAEAGEIESDIWKGLGFTMQDLLAYPGAREIWERRKHQHGAELRAFIESHVPHAGAPRIYESGAAKPAAAASAMPERDGAGKGGQPLS